MAPIIVICRPYSKNMASYYTYTHIYPYIYIHTHKREEFTEYFEDGTLNCFDGPTNPDCKKNPCITNEQAQIAGTESCMSAGYAHVHRVCMCAFMYVLCVASEPAQVHAWILTYWLGRHICSLYVCVFLCVRYVCLCAYCDARILCACVFTLCVDATFDRTCVYA